MSASAALAKGPLSSALGQWAFVGFGTFVIFTGDSGVSKSAQEVGRIAFKLLTGKSGPASLLLGDEVATSSLRGSQQPIIIQNLTPSASSASERSFRGIGALVQLTVGAGLCWASYIALSQLLPEHLKELLPVTRGFFDAAVTSLGLGIIRVRDALSAQIAALSHKQDDLSAKQDDTHASVLGLRGDVGNVRSDLDDISLAIARCESSLTDAAGRQTYVSRGVRLLVACVGDMMRTVNPQAAEELARFIKLEMGADDHGEFDHLADNDNATDDPHHPVTPGGGSHYSKQRQQQQQYPASPQLSEISGSNSHSRDVLPFSLPQAQTLRPPPSSRSMGRSISMPPPPPEVPSMSSPPLINNGRMLYMRAASQRSKAPAPSHYEPADPSPVSSPEDEVPGHESSAPKGGVCLNEVDQLLDLIRNGGNTAAIIQARA